VHRKAIHTATDRREGDTPQSMFARHLEATPIAARQLLWFATVAPGPHRPHRMDHIFCRKLVAPGQLGFACCAAAQFGAFVVEFRSGRPVDGSIYSAAAK